MSAAVKDLDWLRVNLRVNAKGYKWHDLDLVIQKLMHLPVDTLTSLATNQESQVRANEIDLRTSPAMLSLTTKLKSMLNQTNPLKSAMSMSKILLPRLMPRFQEHCSLQGILKSIYVKTYKSDEGLSVKDRAVALRQALVGDYLKRDWRASLPNGFMRLLGHVQDYDSGKTTPEQFLTDVRNHFEEKEAMFMKRTVERYNAVLASHQIKSFSFVHHDDGWTVDFSNAVMIVDPTAFNDDLEKLIKAFAMDDGEQGLRSDLKCTLPLQEVVSVLEELVGELEPKPAA